MSAMPSPDKNEPNKITWSHVVGWNYTRHEQREFTCSAVQYGRQRYGSFSKTRPPVSFVMSKFQKQNLVKVPFHFVSQQKTRSSAVVFNAALAVRPFLALLPNPVGSTAKTSLLCIRFYECILFVHLWELCKQNSQEKHLLALFGGVIRRHDGILAGFLWSEVTLPHRKPINGLVLRSFCFLTNQRKVQILD